MVLALLLSAALASTPRATVQPPRARPGDVVRVEVRGVAEAPSGELAGRALQFFAADGGVFRAYAGLPVELAPGPAAARVETGGRVLEARFEVVEPRWREKVLSVPPQFTEERPPEVEARVQEDKAAFGLAFAQPAAPPAFTRPFEWPRVSRITGRFGDLRTFNGATQGQHYGTDLPGPVGAPVRASNDGTVVLVRDAWTSGLTVVLFHGANLYTVYFHLSRADVALGDRVRRGDRLGALGASGRASGPHLHWGAKVGDLYVDPESLLALTGGASKPQAKPSGKHLANHSAKAPAREHQGRPEPAR
jgi:murein DD-endopeptidase MepM/ murein hydrolase activator NlpD